MLTRFLFWNLKRRPLHKLIAELAGELDVDFVVLPECAMDQASVVASLSGAGVGRFWAVHPLASGVKTFTRLSRGEVVYDWNTFDQVLLRPDLMYSLIQLRIIDRVGVVSLLRGGRPDSKIASDHLPLFVELDL